MAKSEIKNKSAKKISVKKSAVRNNKITKKTETFPIVGIGASAGGLEALEAFFSKMPSDSNMAFVIIHKHTAQKYYGITSGEIYKDACKTD